MGTPEAVNHLSVRCSSHRADLQRGPSISRFRRWLWPCLLAGSAWSCYEIPPSLPEGYIGSAPEAPGWPPPCAYDPEPLHPLNRWFHRAFSARDFSGLVMGVDPAEPLPSWVRLSSVDRAELSALTEALAQGRLGARPGAGRQAITDLVVRSDVLQVAARLEAGDFAEGDNSGGSSRRLSALLLEVAKGPGMPALDGWPPETEPPPLRRGKWLELELELGTGLRPETSDLRWTRILCSQRDTDGGSRRGPDSGGCGAAFEQGGQGQGAAPTEPCPPGGARIVFVRPRVVLGPEGAPELVPLSSECWEAEARAEVEAAPGQSLQLRLWRWDRARWAAGGDPWRECDPVPGAGLEERGPGFDEALAAASRAMAAGRCREYAPRSPPEAVARAQLEIAKESLRALLDAAGRQARG
jgi:hypothetical protein